MEDVCYPHVFRGDAFSPGRMPTRRGHGTRDGLHDASVLLGEQLAAYVTIAGGANASAETVGDRGFRVDPEQM